MKYLLDTDHISFLQRRAGSEFTNLAARLTQHRPADFALSVVSFHEQILGAHTFINRARTTADIIRGYTLLLETLQGFQRLQFYHLRIEQLQFLMDCEHSEFVYLRWIYELQQLLYRMV